MEKIDLHIHTNLSDGVLSPEEVVKYAIENNCYKIAITDHEVITDYTELSKKYNINIVSGIEFNTDVKRLHILGYGINDYYNINKEMETLKKYNEMVSYKVIEKMQKDNIDISIEKVKEFMKKINLNCDVMDKRKIVRYLIEKSYANNVYDAYNKLIGREQKYYIPNMKKTPEEIIDLIKKSGGISVLAHPDTLELSIDELIKEIKKLHSCGLNGLEIINGKTSGKNINIYSNIANELGLIKTVGSDFHNPKKDNIGIETSKDIYKNFTKRLSLNIKI